jgi:heme-degrading monooxygenase HmoA
MKIAVVYRPPALDAETYKATWASDVAKGNPEGLIFHAGVGEGDDFFTMSVWESQEAYNAFASGFKETLGAAGFAGGKPPDPAGAPHDRPRRPFLSNLTGHE